MKLISYFNAANTLCRGGHSEVESIEIRKSTSESIRLLMNSNDYYVYKLVMKFISSCMKIRNTLLLSSESDVT